MGDSSYLYIYNGEGVSPYGVRCLKALFQRYYGSKFPCRLLTARQLICDAWEDSAAALIIPGGADVPYAAHLNGRGNQRIRSYVINGGSYLGICAGAYYASAQCVFDARGPMAVVGPRELALYPGAAIGPVVGTYDYQSNAGATLVDFLVSDGVSNKPEEPTLGPLGPLDPLVLRVLVNGGPYFVPACVSGYPGAAGSEIPGAGSGSGASYLVSHRVLGYYSPSASRKLPGLVHVRYGSGNVVLSGPHLDYHPAILPSALKRDKHIMPLLPVLLQEAYKLDRLWRVVGAALGLELGLDNTKSQI